MLLVFHTLTTFAGSYVKSAFEGSQGFVDAKARIQERITAYTASMGFLTATMGEELLQQDKSERRRKVLNWLWLGYSWQTNDQLRKRRIPNSGKWFLNAAAGWINGKETSPLIGYGIRIYIFVGSADFSRCREIVHHVGSMRNSLTKFNCY